MNILVTGAYGQLGKSLKDIIEHAGNGEPNHTSADKNYYIFIDRDDLDIGDREAVINYVQSHFINVIVNCAAYTNVNKAQEDNDAAYAANADGAENLALAAKSVGAVLIHISTDYVFSVENKINTPLPPYEFKGGDSDKDFIPVKGDKNLYGYSKLLGEHLIAETGCKYIIIRTSWLHSDYGNNFVKTFCKKIIEGENLKVVYDQVGAPTYAPNLAAFIHYIIEANTATTRYLSKTGVYNYADEGAVSWFDVVQFIRAYLTSKKIGQASHVVIQPCRSSEFPQPVERPSYSVFDTSLTKETFNIPIPYWADGVEAAIEAYLKDKKL